MLSKWEPISFVHEKVITRRVFGDVRDNIPFPDPRISTQAYTTWNPTKEWTSTLCVATRMKQTPVVRYITFHHLLFDRIRDRGELHPDFIWGCHSWNPRLGKNVTSCFANCALASDAGAGDSGVGGPGSLESVLQSNLWCHKSTPPSTTQLLLSNFQTPNMMSLSVTSRRNTTQYVPK